MFAPFPGFEEVTLRVRVGWQNEGHWVLARIEQWPDGIGAVLTCALEGRDEGEWVILRAGGTPYFVQNSLRGAWGLDEEEEDEENDEVWTPETAIDSDVTAEFADAIRRAFKHDLFCVARVFQLPAPHNSNIAALTKTRCVWHGDWSFFSPAVFQSSHPYADLSEARARAQLFSEWKNESSDARFAWNWASWSGDERLRQLSGIPEYFADLESRMKLILQASTQLWRDNTRLLWRFYPWAERENGAEHQRRCLPIDLSNGTALVENNLYQWRSLLLKNYEPQWCDKWAAQHQCVNTTIQAKERGFAEIQFHQPPTAHEQLEAKLALRDWLRNAATPDVAAGLLASLDE